MRNMKKVIVYESNQKSVTFRDLKDKDCFCSNGILYMKISEQDLKEYGINQVNAISIENAGLTFFQDDEEVNRVRRNIL